MRMRVSKRRRFVRPSLFLNGVFLTAATFATPAEAKQSMFFASDIHDNASRLAEMIDHAKTVQPIDFYGLVGDYGPGMNTTSGDYQAVTSVLNQNRIGTAPFVLSEGNHDATNHLFTDGTGPVPATRLPNNGTYNVYVINFEDFRNTQKDVVGDLLTYLSSYTDKKVLFILCHYPLHSNRDTDLEGRASELFSTINTVAGSQQIDIVVLWGHNHRQESLDKDINYIVMPGGTVSKLDPLVNNPKVIDGVEQATFKFAYINAGYIYPVTTDDYKPLPPETVHSSVITVTDSAVLLDRYEYPKTTKDGVYGYHRAITPETHAAYARKSPVRALGDVNGDGQININDALLTARYSANLTPSVFFVESADVNLDRKVDINDALLLARYSAGLLGTLPPPADYAAPVVGEVTTEEQAVQAVQNAMNP